MARLCLIGRDLRDGIRNGTGYQVLPDSLARVVLRPTADVDDSAATGRVTSQFIRRGSATIELLAFREPAAFGPQNRRRINQLGLTHLSFRECDVAAVIARIVELCGVVVEASRTAIDLGAAPLEFVYCTDLDGVRVELMDLGGRASPTEPVVDLGSVHNLEPEAGNIGRRCILGTGWLRITGICTGIALAVRPVAIPQTPIGSN